MLEGGLEALLLPQHATQRPHCLQAAPQRARLAHQQRAELAKSSGICEKRGTRGTRGKSPHTLS